MSWLLGELQVEITPGGVVTKRKLYSQQVRRSWGINSKSVTLPMEVSGPLVFRVKINIEKVSFVIACKGGHKVS